MIRRRLGTIRGQLVLWYLSVLAILLLVLGIALSISLSDYLRSSTSSGLREAAFAELRVLGPCFIQTPGELNRNAQSLAELLGSHDTAVKIVTGSGVTLADHGFGFSGQSQPLRLSAATIRRLIASARSPLSTPAARLRPTSCSPLTAEGRTHHRTPTHATGGLSQGNLVLVAVPLGPFGSPVGYALLGRSQADANATVQRTQIAFALGAFAALILAALVALPLINRALRPLRRIARTAGAIAAGDLQRRANLSYSPDEIGRLGIAFDTMVDRLQAALTAANESEERMRRFLADASHELRTPLTVLRGMSEVLLRQGSREGGELASGLEAMHEESVKLSRLVDDLLTLTRLDAGQPLNPEQVEVGPYLEEFVNRYAAAWPRRRIMLELDSLNGAEARVDVDAFRRILTNLVDNAARYSATGKPITLAGRAQSGTVTVAVRDEGPGLAAEDAAHVFERFYQGTGGRSGSSGGTGLGLAIVQALVRQSGGEVRMETGPDRGTDVYLTLPSNDRV